MTPEGIITERLFKIVNKDGKVVPFKLNKAQRMLDDHMSLRNLVPKSRQQGVSRFVLARYTAKCMAYENETCAIISHESEATQRLLDQCRFFLQNMEGGLTAETERNNAHTISFKRTGSKLYIGTAGSVRFGRGDTIRNLHCSEYAFWENPGPILAGLFQAVPMKTGEIWIESTGNGRGNDYHQRVMQAYSGNSRWKCHFLPWTIDPDCNLEVTDQEATHIMKTLDEEEKKLIKQFNLGPGQLLFRRYKLEELQYDERLWKQEYPATIDECFQTAKGGVFVKTSFVHSDEWTDQGNNLFTLNPHPISHGDKEWNRHDYVIGVDPAGGTERDSSVIQVFHLGTREQVAEYASNTISPDTLAHRVNELAMMFNYAYVVIEANNHGPVVLDNLRKLNYPSYLIHSTATGGSFDESPGLMDLGFRTTVRSKPLLIGNLKKKLANEGWIIHSPALNDELSTFIEDETGKMGAAPGTHDDRVIACALALIAHEKAETYSSFKPLRSRIPANAAKNPFLFDTVLEELNNRGKQGMISPQTWSLLP